MSNPSTNRQPDMMSLIMACRLTFDLVPSEVCTETQVANRLVASEVASEVASLGRFSVAPKPRLGGPFLFGKSFIKLIVDGQKLEFRPGCNGGHNSWGRDCANFILFLALHLCEFPTDCLQPHQIKKVHY